MADNTVVHPKGSYKISNIGPSNPWDFTSNGQKVQMMGYDVQFEGIADWIKVNKKADSDAPKVGDVLEGQVEDTGKFGLKFQAEKKGGFGGGKGFSAGAAWANAVQTAATVLGEYAKINPEFSKGVASMDDYLDRLEQVAPAVKSMVDRLAGNDKKDESKDDKSEAESGVSAGQPDTAPTPEANTDTPTVGGGKTNLPGNW